MWCRLDFILRENVLEALKSEGVQLLPKSLTTLLDC